VQQFIGNVELTTTIFVSSASPPIGTVLRMVLRDRMVGLNRILIGEAQ